MVRPYLQKQFSPRSPKRKLRENTFYVHEPYSLGSRFGLPCVRFRSTPTIKAHGLGFPVYSPEHITSNCGGDGTGKQHLPGTNRSLAR